MSHPTLPLPVAKPPARRRLRSLSLLTLVGVALLAVLWFFGGIAVVLNHFVANAIHARHYEKAEQLLGYMQQMRFRDSESMFWEARLRRKLLEFEEFPKMLAEAKEGGFDPDRLRTEALLFQAQTGRVRDIVTQLNELMVAPGNDGAEICEAYVNGALIAGSPELARMILPVWKLEFPKDPQPHYAEARLVEYEGNVDKSIEELRTAIRKDANHRPSRYALGRILLAQNRVAEAIEQLQVASEMLNNAAAAFQIAKCEVARGNQEKARDLLTALVSLPTTKIRRSFALVGEPESGLPIQKELGTVEYSLGNLKASIYWLDIVLKHDPQELDARYARATALRDLGELKEAEFEASEVLRIRTLLLEVDRLVDEITKDPASLHLEKRCRIGELFIKYENARRGEFWLKEALNIDPEYKPAHALLAEYYLKLSEREPGYAELAREHQRAASQPAETPFQESR